MSTTLRMGLVGLNFGRHIADQLTTRPGLPVALQKVCDLDSARAQAAADGYHVPVAPSLDALLADPEIDVIGLFTGPNGRAELVRRIIRAGKDVMTTKPFEIDAESALSVLREAKALGRVVHMNSPNARPFGEAAVIQEWIAAGAIGRPTLAQSSVWCYYGATPADGTWYDDPVRCPLAPMFRLGIYPLNILLSIFGDPVSVQVMHTRVETERPTPDNTAMTVRFRSDAIINLVASFVVGGPDCYKNSLTIGGTRGTIYYATGPKPRAGEAPEMPVILSNDAGVVSRIPQGRSGEYDWEFFAQRVQGDAPADATTPEDVVAAIRVVNAMSRAEQTGETVSLG